MTARLFFCCVITECWGTHCKTSATTTYHMIFCAVCCHSSIWWWPMRFSAHWSTAYVTAAELERIEYLFSWWKRSTFYNYEYEANFKVRWWKREEVENYGVEYIAKENLMIKREMPTYWLSVQWTSRSFWVDSSASVGVLASNFVTTRETEGSSLDCRRMRHSFIRAWWS